MARHSTADVAGKYATIANNFNCYKSNGLILYQAHYAHTHTHIYALTCIYA